MSKQRKNISQSVLDRLNKIAREQGVTADSLYLRYVAERFLYRLSISEYRASFVLKGGTMFTVWQGTNYRATRDIDFLGHSVDNSLENIKNILYAIIQIEVPTPDGITFLGDEIEAREINEDADYHGVRVNIQTRIISARITLQVDIGFGDQVIPNYEQREYPTLLDDPQPSVYTYSIYSFIAEKFEAIIALGISNSRLKDFSDIYSIIQTFDIDGELLKQAIHTTFKQRRTELPAETPIAFTNEYYDDQQRIKWWKSFSKKIAQMNEITLSEVTTKLIPFIMPVVNSIHLDIAFTKKWDKTSQSWVDVQR